MAETEAAALWRCFERTTFPLIDQNVTPERYKLAMEGACLDEERKVLEAAEAYLSAMDQGYSEITARTMAKLRSYHRDMRAQMISRYVVGYETTMSSRKSQP